MKPYDETAGATSTIYRTPTGEAVKTASEGFILAISLTVVLVLVGNVAAVALHVWDGRVFWNFVLIALIPWGGLVCGFGIRLYRFALPKLELAVKHDLDKSGGIGDPVRFIPLRGGSAPKALEDGEVYPQDVEFFIEEICGGRDHTQREWRGETMPSGLTCWNEYHAALIEPLVTAGAIVGRSEGVKGRLVVHNANQIISMIGLQPLP